MRILAFIACLLTTGSAFAGDVSHYDITLEIFPDKEEIRAEARLTLLPRRNDLQRLEFYLNQGLEITGLSSDAGLERFTLDRARAGEYRYVPKGSAVAVEFDRPLPARQQTGLNLSYQGWIVEDPWGVNSLNDKWVEIALYSGWFPYHPDQVDFTYEVTVKIDAAYQVVGSGIYQLENGHWRIVGDDPASDIVVIAAPGLKTRTVGNEALTVTLACQKLPDEQIDTIAADVQRILAQYEGWFQRPASRNLTVVLASRQKGGGYARPGFVVTLYDGDPGGYKDFVKNLAHEISHFWWTGASTTTWEDWLNESFAEYSALMILRALHGEELFQGYIVQYQQAADGASAILGFDRSGEKAFDTLYRKGPLALYHLEKEIGSVAFLQFLGALLEQGIKTTERLLDTLEGMTSTEVRQGFEERLQN